MTHNLLREDRNEYDRAQQRLPAMVTDAQMVAPLSRIYDRVVALWKHRPAISGHYGLLIYHYYRHYHRGYMESPFDGLHRVPSPESITRLFRLAVKNNDIIPSTKIRYRRIQRERAIRHAIVKEL